MSRTAERAGSRGSARPRTRRRCSAAANGSLDGLFDEAVDFVEVVRRLWDSWEDDAIIRDVATGRYVDIDKLHYIDFTGKYFSVKGPSITPRPPQGQPVVAALAHAGPVYEFAAASCRSRVHHAYRRRLAARHPRRGHRGRRAHLKVFADVLVSFGGDGRIPLRCAQLRRQPSGIGGAAAGVAAAGHRRRAAAAGRQRHRSPGDRRRGGAAAAAGRAISHPLPGR